MPPKVVRGVGDGTSRRSSSGADFSSRRGSNQSLTYSFSAGLMPEMTTDNPSASGSFEAQRGSGRSPDHSDDGHSSAMSNSTSPAVSPRPYGGSALSGIRKNGQLVTYERTPKNTYNLKKYSGAVRLKPIALSTSFRSGSVSSLSALGSMNTTPDISEEIATRVNQGSWDNQGFTHCGPITPYSLTRAERVGARVTVHRGRKVPLRLGHVPKPQKDLDSPDWVPESTSINAGPVGFGVTQQEKQITISSPAAGTSGSGPQLAKSKRRRPKNTNTIPHLIGKYMPFHSASRSVLKDLDNIMESQRVIAESDAAAAGPNFHNLRAVKDDDKARCLEFLKAMKCPTAEDLVHFGVGLRMRRVLARLRFRWAVGQILIENERKGDELMRVALAHMFKMKKLQASEEEEKKKTRRWQIANQLFTEVFARIKSAAAKTEKLGEAKYLQYKAQFDELDANNTGELSLADVTQMLLKTGLKIDSTMFKRIDKDRSGRLELDELLNAMYPSMSLRDIRLAKKSWDGKRAVIKDGKFVVTTQEQTNKLSEESKKDIADIFAMCDNGLKGYLVQSDVLSLVENKEWQDSLNLRDWFNDTDRLSREQFEDKMKLAYPPYYWGVEKQQKEVKMRISLQRIHGLSKELMDMQDSMTSAV